METATALRAAAAPALAEGARHRRRLVQVTACDCKHRVAVAGSLILALVNWFGELEPSGLSLEDLFVEGLALTWHWGHLIFCSSGGEIFSSLCLEMSLTYRLLSVWI